MPPVLSRKCCALTLQPPFSSVRSSRALSSGLAETPHPRQSAERLQDGGNTPLGSAVRRHTVRFARIIADLAAELDIRNIEAGLVRRDQQVQAVHQADQLVVKQAA